MSASDAQDPSRALRPVLVMSLIINLPQIAARYEVLRSFPIQVGIVSCAMLAGWPLLQSGYRPPITFATHARHAMSMGLVMAAFQEGFATGFTFGAILAMVFALLLEFAPLRPLLRRGA